MLPMPMTEGRILPNISFRQIDLPEVVTWQIGEQHYIVVKVKMIAKRSREDLPPEDQNKIEGDFSMLSVKALGDQPIDAKSLERREMSNLTAKILTDINTKTITNLNGK